jgi:dCMP deaminase
VTVAGASPGNAGHPHPASAREAGWAVAYVPVLHEGYRRFLERHARGGRCLVVGRELYADERPLAKDIRALEPALVARALDAWGICDSVAVLDQAGAHTLAAEAARVGVCIAMPAEDVSYALAKRFFERCDVRFDTVFLRWDKTRTAQLLGVAPQRVASTGELGEELRASAPGRVASTGQLEDDLQASAPRPVADGGGVVEELRAAAELEAARSIDWWRRVGAAMRLAGGELLVAHNEHQPHRLSAYAVGDPRANFHKGVALELSTATHAEARLIAQAAREGLATQDGVLYVTDFPCPPCAKLIAAAGIARLYYREGYAVLDGQDVLEAAGVEIVRVD